MVLPVFEEKKNKQMEGNISPPINTKSRTMLATWYKEFTFIYEEGRTNVSETSSMSKPC